MSQMIQERPLCCSTRLGPDQQLLVVGDIGVARPDLLAIHDQYVPVDDALVRSESEAEPGGFGEACTTSFLARKNAREMEGLLRFGAEAISVGPAWLSPTKVQSAPTERSADISLVPDDQPLGR